MLGEIDSGERPAAQLAPQPEADQLLPWIGDLPYVLFFPTVIAVGFLCGSAAGLAAALLSVVAAWLLILPWDGSELALRH